MFSSLQDQLEYMRPHPYARPDAHAPRAGDQEAAHVDDA